MSERMHIGLSRLVTCWLWAFSQQPRTPRTSQSSQDQAPSIDTRTPTPRHIAADHRGARLFFIKSEGPTQSLPRKPLTTRPDATDRTCPEKGHERNNEAADSCSSVVEAVSGWFTMNDTPELSKYAIQDIQD